jgi:Spy/CpxP family protein refolding chaperone
MFPAVGALTQSPGCADEYSATGRCCVDWNKLNLTSGQSQQIDQLNCEWTKDYNELKPVIVDDQQKLQKLLADHNSDPVEVMAMQQQIARKREQLNGLATANYLRKRQVLNENQQFNLEQMIKELVRKRQAQMYPNQHTDTVVTDRIQDLMNRVRNIWPVQAEK